MPYTPIVPKGSAPPLAPYSPGAKAGNAVYVSGTLAYPGLKPRRSQAPARP